MDFDGNIVCPGKAFFYENAVDQDVYHLASQMRRIAVLVYQMIAVNVMNIFLQ